jgi:hypothetical protein
MIRDMEGFSYDPISITYYFVFWQPDFDIGVSNVLRTDANFRYQLVAPFCRSLALELFRLGGFLEDILVLRQHKRKERKEKKST